MAQKKPKSKPSRTRRDDPTDPEVAVVGQRFRAAREELGLNQKDMGELIGGDQSSVSRFENGKRGLATPVLIRLLQQAAARGVDIHHCLLGTGTATRDVVLGAHEPKLLRELQEVVRRHVGNGNGSGDTPHQVNGPRKRGNKR